MTKDSMTIRPFMAGLRLVAGAALAVVALSVSLKISYDQPHTPVLDHAKHRTSCHAR